MVVYETALASRSATATRPQPEILFYETESDRRERGRDGG